MKSIKYLLVLAIAAVMAAPLPAAAEYPDRPITLIIPLGPGGSHDLHARGIMPADLAARVQLSLDYFSRLFRKTYGVAPKTYLKRERMRVASHMLAETDASVKQVAAELGFENVSFFCRQFRSVYALSPARYRVRQNTGDRIPEA